MPELYEIEQQPRTREGPKPATPTRGGSLSQSQIAANAAQRREQMRREEEEAQRRLIERREQELHQEDQGHVVGVKPRAKPVKDVSAQARFRVGEGKAYAEKPKAEKSASRPVAAPSPVAKEPNVLAETAKDMVPGWGSYRQGERLAKSWNKSSNWRKALDSATLALSVAGDVTLVGGLGLKAVKGVGGGAKVVQSLSSPKAAELVTVGRTASKAGQPVKEIVIRGASSDLELEEAVKLARAVKDEPAFAKSTLRLENRASLDGVKRLTAVDDALPAGVQPKGVLNVDRPLSKAEIEAISRAAKSNGVRAVTVHADIPTQTTRAELEAIAKSTAARHNPLPEMTRPGESAEAFRARLAAARAARAADTQRALATLKASKTGSPKAVGRSGRALARALARQGVKVEYEQSRLARGGKIPKKVNLKSLVLEPNPPRAIPSAARGGGVGTLPRTTGGGTSTRLRTTSSRLTVAVAGHVPGSVPAAAETPKTREWTQPGRSPEPVRPGRLPHPDTKRLPAVTSEPEPAPSGKPVHLRSPGHEVEPDVIGEQTGKRKFRSPGHEVEDDPVPEQKGKPALGTRTALTQATQVKTAPAARFVLPSGETLPAGLFVREISWIQGNARVFRDLDTGETRYEAYRGRIVTPRQSFKVTRTDHTPPRPQRLRLGMVDVLIRPDRLSFEGHPERSGQGLRRRFFGRRRL